MGEEKKEKKSYKATYKGKYERGSKRKHLLGVLEGVRKNEKEFQITGVRDGGMKGP